MRRNGIEILSYTNYCSREKKRDLLEMAKAGLLRPIKRKDMLGRALSRYTCKKSNAYDPVFDKEIRGMAPLSWFSEKSYTSKQLLLEMAKCDSPRPHRFTQLGRALVRFTHRTANSYDSVFANKIKRIAPNWFRVLNGKTA